MRAISTFNRDDGMSTRGCRDSVALRIRVSMSAIGSVIFVTLDTSYQLPATSVQLRDLADGSWRLTALFYQLLLVTPAISPSSASWRKQRRHSANLRR